MSCTTLIVPRASRSSNSCSRQSGKLLRKRLAAWFASNRQADRLHFKDLFRNAARHDLIEPDAVERWLRYRDNRNYTAHDYGEDFAEATLRLIPEFIEDAKALAGIIEQPTMTDRQRLSQRHRDILLALLRKHLRDTEVWAYGSRVNGPRPRRQRPRPRAAGARARPDSARTADGL